MIRNGDKIKLKNGKIVSVVKRYWPDFENPIPELRSGGCDVKNLDVDYDDVYYVSIEDIEGSYEND
jgi:hypothetical protein